jgi:predicted DNA-binding transcriptional regulator YafY
VLGKARNGGWKELVRFILSWQPDVKVLRPAKLRDRVREKMIEGLQAPEGGKRRSGEGR